MLKDFLEGMGAAGETRRPEDDDLPGARAPPLGRAFPTLPCAFPTLPETSKRRLLHCLPPPAAEGRLTYAEAVSLVGMAGWRVSGKVGASDAGAALCLLPQLAFVEPLACLGCHS